jgi:hypothetical protein
LSGNVAGHPGGLTTLTEWDSALGVLDLATFVYWVPLEGPPDRNGRLGPSCPPFDRNGRLGPSRPRSRSFSVGAGSEK